MSPATHDMTDVISRLVGRVAETLAQASGRYPMCARPATGEWTWSDDGGWFGGFWPGLLWLSALATGDERYARAALDASNGLRPRAEAPTVLRGFLFWYGAGLGATLGRAGSPADLAVAAARSLADDFDERAQLLPPGTEDAAEYRWPRPGACIDGVPGTVPLLAFASEHTQDARLRTIAIAHARRHHALCVRGGGSLAQCATYGDHGEPASQVSINGSSEHSTWARGHAWGMLGLAQAAHLSGELVQPAVDVADWYLAHVPDDLVCYWDFDDPAIPDAPRDTSATAIAAAAMAKLAPLAGDRYRDAAHDALEALARDHLSARGALTGGRYDAASHEVVWGDYFVLETALALRGDLDATRV